MEEKEVKFELTPVYVETESQFVVKDFPIQRQSLKDYLASQTQIKVIKDDETNKVVKASRTAIRKLRDALKDTRISVIKLYMGIFESELKELEGMLDEADKKLKTYVDAYALSKKVNEPVAPKLFTLTVKGYDEKALAKIRDAAIKVGLSAEIK
ncbi:MAG: hypothetical protein M0Q41_13405 [Bacteroidales bacterium]|nr:hypothetical protein [Acholeplasmataceae bacterium]MCK9449953.1 hypothetical protein [Bacteroidales bacterium]